MKRLFLMGLVVLAVAACVDRDVTGVNDEVAVLDQSPEFHIARGADHIKVMSQNMYFGAPLGPVLAETIPALIPVRVAEAWGVMLQTDFPARARAMAAQIARADPHVVGLQEVAIFRTQTPSDIAVPPGETPDLTPNATEVFYDFLEILLDELDQRGASYSMATTITTSDVEVPRLDSIVNMGGEDVPFFTDVRLTDRDVILVRNDVTTANAGADLYSTYLPAPSGVNVLRGWTSVEVEVGGDWLMFVNTHLESDYFPVRNGQAMELIGMLALIQMPLIVVGDLNSGPGRPLEPGEDPTAYDMMLGAGYMDLWVDGISAKGHKTCCHAGDLSNRRPTLDQRIDLVFYRNFTLKRRVFAWSWLVNAKRKDLRRYGTWSSDHAGIFSWLVFPRAGMVADD